MTNINKVSETLIDGIEKTLLEKRKGTSDINDHNDLWMNPLFPMHDRLDIARGAIRDQKEEIRKLKETYLTEKNTRENVTQKAWLIEGSAGPSAITLYQPDARQLANALSINFGISRGDYTCRDINILIVGNIGPQVSI